MSGQSWCKNQMQQIFVDEGSIFRSTFRGLLEDEIFLCLRLFCIVPRNMFYKGNFRRVVRDVLRASPARGAPYAHTTSAGLPISWLVKMTNKWDRVVGETNEYPSRRGPSATVPHHPLACSKLPRHPCHDVPALCCTYALPSACDDAHALTTMSAPHLPWLQRLSRLHRAGVHVEQRWDHAASASSI
jgi:hypothetical protein